MSKKGIILNIYFNEHFEIETFSLNFFFVVVRVRSKIFSFLLHSLKCSSLYQSRMQLSP